MNTHPKASVVPIMGHVQAVAEGESKMAYQLQITRKSTGINPTATIECRDRADLRKQLADNIRGDHGTAHISLRIVGDRGVVYSGTVEGLRGKRHLQGQR